MMIIWRLVYYFLAPCHCEGGGRGAECSPSGWCSPPWCTVVLELVASEDQVLLVRGTHPPDKEMHLFILDLGLDVVDRVAALNPEGDRLAHQCLDKDQCLCKDLLFAWCRRAVCIRALRRVLLWVSPRLIYVC